MKTTLMISDPVWRALKKEAAERKKTMSELVETALRAFLEREQDGAYELPPLPTFLAGTPRVDISDRDALHDLMGDNVRL